MLTPYLEDGFVRVPTVDEVLTVSCLEEVAKHIDMLDLSRLATTKWLENKVMGYPFPILDEHGVEFRRHEDMICRAYGASDYSWNSNVKRFAKRPPLRAPRAALALRLQLWVVAFRIDGMISAL